MANAALHAFIDEEMLRAPMTLDLAIDAVHDHWRLLRSGRGLGRDSADPARLLQQHRADLVAVALKTLRESVQADLASPNRSPTEAATPTRKGAALSLIDEDDVADDIEINRCIEAVRLRAEAELRELQTYTSALVNDPNVSRDTNPFRPEVMVRALWQGVQSLPLSRTTQAAFMREAAEPLAKGLKMAYASAVSRLEERGVTPAAHRTIVMTGGTLYGSHAPRYRPPTDLHVLRDSAPTPLDALPGRPAAPPPRAEDALPPGADPQLILLLTRLFDEIHADRSLSAELSALMLRLQPAAVRLALREPTMLDSYDHAVWRFMDTLAHTTALSPPGERLRVLGLGRNLIDHLCSNEVQDGRPFVWAIERLLAMARHGLNQALANAQPEIQRLLAKALKAEQQAHGSAPPSGPVPLDVGALDTVPADLMADTAPAPLGGSPLMTLSAGDHLRAWLQGEWRVLQVLWQDKPHAQWLLREPAADRLWAVRPQALERLASVQLAQTLHQRSLVRRAAERVLRAM